MYSKVSQGFDELLGLSRMVFPYVEEHKFLCDYWFLTRWWNKVREFGALLANHGYLEDVEDVFHLSRHEVASALEGVITSANYSAIVIPHLECLADLDEAPAAIVVRIAFEGIVPVVGVHLAQEAQPAQVDAQDGHAGPCGQGAGAEHGAIAAEEDDEVLAGQALAGPGLVEGGMAEHDAGARGEGAVQVGGQGSGALDLGVIEDEDTLRRGKISHERSL